MFYCQIEFLHSLHNVLCTRSSALEEGYWRHSWWFLFVSSVLFQTRLSHPLISSSRHIYYVSCINYVIAGGGGRGSLQIMTLLDGGEGSEITVLRRGVPANVNGIPWILGEFCNCYVVMPWQFSPQTRKLWLWKYIKLLVCVLAYYQNKRYENHFLIILPVSDLCRSYVSLALVTCCIFRTSHISKPI